MFGSMDIAGTVAFLIACQQGKLADGEDFSVNLHDTAVHHAVLIVENA